MVNVKKKETLTVDPKNPSEYKVATGTEALPTDAWNRERDAYQEAYAGNAGNPGPRAGYGLQDLNYYGSFFIASGLRIRLAAVRLRELDDGLGSLLALAPGCTLPGLGYTLASPYPWGWLPYHYGSWAFLGGALDGHGYRAEAMAAAGITISFQTTPVVAKAPAGWTASDRSGASRRVNLAKPTVMVGKAAFAPAYIPGGRMPPDFGSVIRGRGVGASATGEQHRGARMSGTTPVN